MHHMQYRGLPRVDDVD